MEHDVKFQSSINGRGCGESHLQNVWAPQFENSNLCKGQYPQNVWTSHFGDSDFCRSQYPQHVGAPQFGDTDFHHNLYFVIILLKMNGTYLRFLSLSKNKIKLLLLHSSVSHPYILHVIKIKEIYHGKSYQLLNTRKIILVYSIRVVCSPLPIFDVYPSLNRHCHFHF